MVRDITIMIPNAVPKGRPRGVLIRGKVVMLTPKRTRESEKEVAEIIRVAWPGGPSRKRFFVEMFFWCRSSRTDGDNLEKLLLDAAEGIVFENDSQVETVVRTKLRDTKKPATLVRFVELEDDEHIGICWDKVGDIEFVEKENPRG